MTYTVKTESEETGQEEIGGKTEDVVEDWGSEAEGETKM